MNKVLHLTLKKKWFDEILSGKKKVEYREIKPYWQIRLIDNKGIPIDYKKIIFKNGYGKNVPIMVVEYLGLNISDKYEIQLGKILETVNLHTYDFK